MKATEHARQASDLLSRGRDLIERLVDTYITMRRADMDAMEAVISSGIGERSDTLITTQGAKDTIETRRAQIREAREFRESFRAWLHADVEDES